ncbi:MAG TPA: hypothetical protein VG435_09125 [Acidimicrobiales bacterium]|jgi:hypothetical protein|nr:hypothetical protein [Acidimicrobiales bacterium]
MFVHPPAGLCFPTVVCPSTIIGAGSDLATKVASDAASSVLQAVSTGLQVSATYLVQHLIDDVQATTSPTVQYNWYGAEMTLMRQVAMLLVLPILLAATIGPVLRQDGRRLLRVWGVGLPVGLFSGLAAAQLASLALSVVDALCQVVVGSHGQDLAAHYAQSMAGVSSVPQFVAMMLSSLSMMGAVLVWLELVVRSAGVYVAVFFMPVALVAYIWPATMSLARRGIELLACLILSKFVIVSCLSLGLAAYGSHDVDGTFAGAGILLMAGFAPFALLRLTPIVEAGVIAHMEGMSRRPFRATADTAKRAAAAPAAAAGHPLVQLLGSKSGAAPSVARDITEQPMAPKAPDFPIPEDRPPAVTGRPR